MTAPTLTALASASRARPALAPAPAPLTEAERVELAASLGLVRQAIEDGRPCPRALAWGVLLRRWTNEGEQR